MAALWRAWRYGSEVQSADCSSIGSGEMVQQFRMLAALPEGQRDGSEVQSAGCSSGGLDSFLSTHAVAYDYL